MSFRMIRTPWSRVVWGQCLLGERASPGPQRSPPSALHDAVFLAASLSRSRPPRLGRPAGATARSAPQTAEAARLPWVRIPLRIFVGVLARFVHERAEEPGLVQPT